MVVTKDSVISVHQRDKPFLTLEESYSQADAGSHAKYGEGWFLADGAFECSFVWGNDKDSIKPGMFFRYDGKPLIGPLLVTHDWGVLVGEAKPPRKKKHTGFEESYPAHIQNTVARATGLAERALDLVNHTVTDPVKMLSRAASMFGFSAQASDKMITGAAMSLPADSSHYDVVRYVAGLATTGNPNEFPDRRYQKFAYALATRSHAMCKKCGLPQ